MILSVGYLITLDSGSVTDVTDKLLLFIYSLMPLPLKKILNQQNLSRNIQMIRDKTFYGFKSDNSKTTAKKAIPWVDVSDDEDRGKQSSMKRKANGHSHLYAQNGHKHKKHRGLNNNEVDQTNGDINGAGPSQTKHMQTQNGAADHTSQHHTKAKAIQEQRMQLPIAKGIVCLLHKI